MSRLLLALALFAWAPLVRAQEARPNVEVVFCLDTTGSMGGLIGAAKQKIWSISNQIATGKPTPILKVGLVAFRDRGDAYITKVFDLTDDLDAVHTNLQSFQAQGGGDFPESVNQALHESVTKISWSKDKKTLKMIFLVGDAPPHMDYPDDVKYPETCKLAIQNDIIINTVQCGNHPQTRKFWEDICRKAEGSYVQIDAHGGPVVAVATPYDADLAKINSEISKGTLVFGRREVQEQGKKKAADGADLKGEAAAARGSYLARNGAAASYDLLQQVKDGKVKLEEVKKDELPDELKGKSLDEQKAHLEKLDKQRCELQKQAIELDQKRSKFIAEKQKENEKNRARDSFDQNVMRILQRQATRANIEYAIDEKK
jgi:Mg-chelatase subunit ChlD